MSIRREFRAWIKTRPAGVRAAARTVKPWHVYRLKTTGQHVVLQAYAENGTVRVGVIGHDDPIRALMNYVGLSVFGISPADLERLRVPSPA